MDAKDWNEIDAWLKRKEHTNGSGPDWLRFSKAHRTGFEATGDETQSTVQPLLETTGEH